MYGTLKIMAFWGLRILVGGFPGGSGVRTPPATSEDTGSTPVWEDPTCHRAAESVHNYWACALEPENHNYWAHVLPLLKPRACAPQQEKLPQ